MKKTKQRILFSTLLAATLLFASLGLSTLFMNKRVSADDDTSTTAYNVTNIEDVVSTYSDKSSDILFGTRFDAGIFSYEKFNEVINSSSYNSALYTDASTNTTVGDSAIESANKYKGNLSYSSDNSKSISFSVKVPKNTILSYRFTFNSKWVYSLSFGQSYRDINSNVCGMNDGYYATITPYTNASNLSKIYPVVKERRALSDRSKDVTIIKNWTPAFCTTSSTSEDGQSITKHTHKIEDGEECTIIYGTYEKSDGSLDIVFILKNKTGEVVFDAEEVKSNSSKYTAPDKDNVFYKYPDNEYVYMGMTAQFNTLYNNHYGYSRDDSGYVSDNDLILNISIAGINSPIAQDVYNTTVSDKTYYEGDSAATVTLPSGYALVDNTATLGAGENNLAATYTISDYYGKVATVNCKVKVTAVDTNKVTLKNSKGSVIGTIYLKESEKYTLVAADKDSGLTEGNKFVGWFDSENNLYPAGYEMNITGDTELTLAEISFTLDGAYLRVAENGGMRYIAQLASDQKDAILAKSVWYGVILPKDRITGDIASAITDSDKVKLTDGHVKVVDGQSNGYFALTGILVSNYSRTFTATSYLEVTYADSTTGKIFTETKDRSVIEIAYAAYNSSDVSDDVKAFVKETYLEKVVFITENEGSYAAADNISISIGGTSTSLNVVKKEGFDLSYTDGKLKISGLTYSASADGNVHIPIIKVESDGSFVEMLNTATEQDVGYVVTFNN